MALVYQESGNIEWIDGVGTNPYRHYAKDITLTGAYTGYQFINKIKFAAIQGTLNHWSTVGSLRKLIPDLISYEYDTSRVNSVWQANVYRREYTNSLGSLVGIGGQGQDFFSVTPDTSVSDDDVTLVLHQLKNVRQLWIKIRVSKYFDNNFQLKLYDENGTQLNTTITGVSGDTDLSKEFLIMLSGQNDTVKLGVKYLQSDKYILSFWAYVPVVDDTALNTEKNILLNPTPYVQDQSKQTNYFIPQYYVSNLLYRGNRVINEIEIDEVGSYNSSLPVSSTNACSLQMSFGGSDTSYTANSDWLYALPTNLSTYIWNYADLYIRETSTTQSFVSNDQDLYYSTTSKTVATITGSEVEWFDLLTRNYISAFGSDTFNLRVYVELSALTNSVNTIPNTDSLTVTIKSLDSTGAVVSQQSLTADKTTGSSQVITLPITLGVGGSIKVYYDDSNFTVTYTQFSLKISGHYIYNTSDGTPSQFQTTFIAKDSMFIAVTDNLSTTEYYSNGSWTSSPSTKPIYLEVYTDDVSVSVQQTEYSSDKGLISETTMDKLPAVLDNVQNYLKNKRVYVYTYSGDLPPTNREFNRITSNDEKIPFKTIVYWVSSIDNTVNDAYLYTSLGTWESMYAVMKNRLLTLARSGEGFLIQNNVQSPPIINTSYLPSSLSTNCSVILLSECTVVANDKSPDRAAALNYYLSYKNAGSVSPLTGSYMVIDYAFTKTTPKNVYSDPSHLFLVGGVSITPPDEISGLTISMYSLGVGPTLKTATNILTAVIDSPSYGTADSDYISNIGTVIYLCQL